MKANILYIVFFLACCVSDNHNNDLKARKNVNSLKMKLINGNWFNGIAFEKRAVWVDEGLLQFHPIDKALDTTINLEGKYVIPPFAEAHNHNLESEYELEQRIQNYLDNGVFYVKQLSAIKRQLEPLMHLYNKPEGIDISTTYGPLTGTGGHPIALREKFFDWGYYDVFASKKDIESHAYFIIDTEEDLNTRWNHILSFKPEFIKFMLLYSEEYEKRKNDTMYFGNKGMNPKLVKKLVQKAHLAGLRVSVHVETAHDFHVAVGAGVDEIAHFPEIDHGGRVAIEDIKMAKEKNITTVTTVTLVKKKSKHENYDELVENIRGNLKLFQQVGATLAIGSDNFNGNSSGEFQFLNELNIFTNLELLNMWTVNATKTIFPNRKVGHLEDGYEASFLVLDKNPLEDLSNITKHIELKIKQGNTIH